MRKGRAGALGLRGELLDRTGLAGGEEQPSDHEARDRRARDEENRAFADAGAHGLLQVIRARGDALHPLLRRLGEATAAEMLDAVAHRVDERAGFLEARLLDLRADALDGIPEL